MKLPHQLAPESLIAIVDTREQHPWDLAPLKTQAGTLDTGDYTLAGCENVVRIERKSLEDLLACVGRERERFDREIQRLLAFPVRILIVEATWAQIEAGQWRSKVTPEAAIGSLLGWQAAGISVHCVSDHGQAGRHAARLLYTVAKRRYRELRAIVACHPDQ